jgi:uroporphyrinogen-III synthase
MTDASRGKRIVNTRAAHQAAALDALLMARGAEPVAYPCIAIVPPQDTTQIDRALRSDYDWLVLTSANTVLVLAQRLKALQLRVTGRVAAVGAATAECAEALLGVRVEVMPEQFIAENLAAALEITSGTRVLLPESAIARPTLAAMLRERGADVEVIPAYQTVRGSGGADVPRLLQARQIDAITFTSSSTVEHFLGRLEAEGGSREHLQGVGIACIGPQTEKTARACGLDISVTASIHTLEGLVEALEGYFR